MEEMVTYFSSHKSELVRPVKLEQVLTAFKTGRFAARIKAVRRVLEQQGELQYKEAKRGLPAIAFCGEFVGGHAKENLVNYNNLLVFDIDHLNDEEMWRAHTQLMADGHILAIWVSPSGTGYKGLIRIEYHNVPEFIGLDPCYKKAFADVTAYFIDRFGIQLDINCSDYSRICYVCWDENLYLNERAGSFIVDCGNVTEDDKKKPARAPIARYNKKTLVYKPINLPGKNSQHDRNVVSAILKYLTKRNLSITRLYDDWLRVGFAIASSFNYDLGLKYFLAFSRLDPDKYDDEKCVEKLKECYANGRGDVTLGTIVEMARSKGFKGSSEDM